MYNCFNIYINIRIRISAIILILPITNTTKKTYPYNFLNKYITIRIQMRVIKQY